MPFGNVIGHDALIQSLRRSVDGGTVGHALVLCGPSAVGKTTVASELAAALVNADEWPGGPPAHPDIWSEDSDVERIGIDSVRADSRANDVGMQEFFSRRAYAAGRRVAIIARAERLTEHATNALLKTLEEPPDKSHIILCTTSLERLSQTIVSRCQIFNVSTVSRDEVARWLRDAHDVAAELSTIAAAISGGRPGAALRLATTPGALQSQVEALEKFLGVGDGDRVAILSSAAELAPSAGAAGRELAIVQLATWASFVRDVACYRQDLPELTVWHDYAEVLREWGNALGPSRCSDVLTRIIEAIDAVSVNANPRLAYETLFLDVFGGQPSPPHVAIPSRSAGLASAPASVAASRRR